MRVEAGVIDVMERRIRPAAEMVAVFLEQLRPALEAAGDRGEREEAAWDTWLLTGRPLTDSGVVRQRVGS